METKAQKIAIIGGGAAGFFAAISSAIHQQNSEIYLYEASNKLLSKVLISGGGRCNVTNNTFDVNELVKGYPRGSKELRGPFTRFNVTDTIKFFEGEDVQLKAEADGRMFPISNSSQTIANCLIEKTKELGVEILMNHKISKISKEINGKYQIYTGKHLEEIPRLFDQVILTTGGSKSSLKLAESLGHTITELLPSLFSFEIKDQRLVDLPGVSFPKVSLELICANQKFKQIGPILITHWGLSGPATIKLSALAAKELYHSDYQAILKINFLPELNFEAVVAELLIHKDGNLKALAENTPLFDLPKRYWLKIIETSSSKAKVKWSELSKKELQKIAMELTQACFQVTGKGVFKDEFVTCGGVSLKEVNFKTMESKISPGLSFAGEVLDIDGITGGYNFQSAWTTGWIAGIKS